MKYSYNWLQSQIEEPLPSPESLKETIIFHAFEVEEVETVGDDSVFDIKTLPDRNADALSHFGMAREIAGLLSLTLKESKSTPTAYPENKDAITLMTDKCHRYISARIDGIAMKKTPQWIKERLEAIGAQSINVVVDCANYIMYDLGQPTHIFDADKVDGPLTVRAAHDGEKIITLSNEERTLTENTIVVADVLGALAIAGVKGGKSAAVTDETKNIIIEVANFDGVSVRKTSRGLGIITDAAKRFENNYPNELALPAAYALIDMLQSIVGGEVKWFEDKQQFTSTKKEISFSSKQISDYLGEEITSDEIKNIFERYGYTFSQNENTFVLTIPVTRPDIVGLADIVEEIGRVRGYEKIQPVPFALSVAQEENALFAAILSAKQFLVEQGFIEVQTYTFRKKGDISVAYGPKDKSALRTNLSDGLKESYGLNRVNAPLLGIEKTKLFEIGTVFVADAKGDIKEDLHIALIDAGTSEEKSFNDYIQEHPEIKEKAFAIPSLQAPFKAWSPYPCIVRDIAVWVDGKEYIPVLEKIMQDFEVEHCVRPALCFDAFEKEGKVSVAYRFVFQATDRTLTTIEVENKFAKLIEEIEKNPHLIIR